MGDEKKINKDEQDVQDEFRRDPAIPEARPIYPLPRNPPMITIRPATKDDLSALFSLDSLALQDRKRKERVERAASAGDCFVAVADGRIVGYGVLEYLFYDQGIISLVMVSAGERRRGIGTALINNLESACNTQKIFTSTNQSNHAMRSLLDRLGYQPGGIIENLDVGDPEMVYFKRLHDARE